MIDHSYFLLPSGAPGHSLARTCIDKYFACLNRQSEVLRILADRFGWSIPGSATFRFSRDRQGFVENVRICCGHDELASIRETSKVPMLHRDGSGRVEAHVRVIANGAAFKDFKAFAKDLGPVEDVPEIGMSIWLDFDKAFKTPGQSIGRVFEMFQQPGIYEVGGDALLFTLHDSWVSWPMLLEAAGARRIRGSEALKLIEDTGESEPSEASV